MVVPYYDNVYLCSDTTCNANAFMSCRTGVGSRFPLWPKQEQRLPRVKDLCCMPACSILSCQELGSNASHAACVLQCCFLHGRPPLAIATNAHH